jgi:hypothetical protein
VALAYGRGLYASDAGALWPLISAADRRVKDRATFERQFPPVNGFTRTVLDQLGAYVTASPVRTVVNGDRATVVLRFRLPDANAPAVLDLLRDWDDDRLEALGPAERDLVSSRLATWHREGTLPVVEGEETLTLVREAGAWRVFVDWAAGVRVRFGAAVGPEVPLEIEVTPAEVTLAPGERVRVTVHATNGGARDVTVRAGHRIGPEAQAEHLALLLCPLFVPVTLAPGEQRDFTSEYLLLGDAPAGLRPFEVVYLFPAPPA